MDVDPAGTEGLAAQRRLPYQTERPALPNHKSISNVGINYQTKAAVAC